MKNLSKSLLLVALLIGYSLPSWAWTSTEGKEFWVALTLSAAPSSGTPTPFIAVSTKKVTTIKITNPNDPSWQGVTRSVGANEWAVFESEIPLSKWYPTTANSIDNIKPQAGQTHNFGLKVETNEDVSVYAALWMQNSFDAANILPTNVLQNEYYTQDYPPYIKPSDGDALAMFTVLATENNTHVTITPSTTTQDGKQAGKPYTVTLNAGQTYYVISKTLQSLSGTYVSANNKIAIFQGNVFTQIPGGKSARDCTYEQAMPIEYWGNQFVVTRSKEKDANRIRVTASNNGTSLSIDGNYMTTIDAGETWEFEMHKTLPTQQDIQHVADDNFVADAVFLETSCPVAVYSYDVSNGYKSTPSEMDNSRGDPSMVWISSLEQRINEITFGVCGTNKTDKHYIDIVCETSSTAQTTITPTPAEAISWNTVNGNSKWSYARVHLSTVGKTGNGNRVFTLKNPQGCIAHVYGNGNDESYAYSVGSSAVTFGKISANSQLFDSEHSFSDVPFCANENITFDASAGSTVIDKVTWDYGDGVSETLQSVSTTHKYTTPGWYDVTATLYAHRDCPDTVYQGVPVNFSFRVDRPDTLYRNVTLCADSVPKYRFTEVPNTKTWTMQDPTVDEIIVDTITSDGDCSNVYILTINAIAQRESDIDLDDIYPLAQRRDSALIPADGYDTGEGLGLYHPTAEYVYTGGYYVRHYYRSNTKCDSTVTYHVTVVKCLDLKAENTQQTVCYMDSIHNLTFSYDRDGNPGSMDLWIDGKKNCPIIFGDKDSKVDDGVSRIHISASAVPVKVYPGYHKAVIKMKDINCDTIAESEPFNLTVLYPDSIFAYKFDNVLTMYKKGHGGNIPGWDFVRYEWYHNDDTIPCGTGPVYHTDEPFTIGDTYYVVLTRTDGMVLRSCEFEIQNHGGIERSGKGNAPDSDGNDTGNMPAANAPAKFIQNRQLYILFEGAVYNMYGQRVKSND